MRKLESHIPVVAVTGTNGKTTTTLLISYIFRPAVGAQGRREKDLIAIGQVFCAPLTAHL